MTEYKCGSAKSCKYGDMCKPNFNIGACSHYKAEEPQTNEKWLKQCNTEQLAEEISHLVFGGDFKKHISKMGYINMHSFKTEIMEWLKQPHTVKE